MGKYDDIINLPHYEPKYHPRMSMYSRASQFAAFSALTGYDEQIKETARLTDNKLDIDDEVREILDAKLQEIQENISNKPQITVTYFIADERKDGGKYVTITNNIKKIDAYKQAIILKDDTEISIIDIIEIMIATN